MDLLSTLAKIRARQAENSAQWAQDLIRVLNPGDLDPRLAALARLLGKSRLDTASQEMSKKVAESFAALPAEWAALAREPRLQIGATRLLALAGTAMADPSPIVALWEKLWDDFAAEKDQESPAKEMLALIAESIFQWRSRFSGWADFFARRWAFLSDPLRLRAVRPLWESGKLTLETQQKLFAASPADSVRARWMESWIEKRESSSWDFLIGIATRDPAPDVRDLAVHGLFLFAGAPPDLEKILSAYAGEKDERVRNRWVEFFFQVLAENPDAFLKSILRQTGTERRENQTLQIIGILTPFATSPTPAGEAFRGFLERVVTSPEILSRGVLNPAWGLLDLAQRRFPELGARILSLVQGNLEKEAQGTAFSADVLAQMISALSANADFLRTDLGIAAILTSALRHRAPAVREAALRSIALLPAQEESTALLTEALPLLPEAQIKESVREAVAAKLSRIPAWAPDQLAKLRPVLLTLSKMSLSPKFQEVRDRLEAALTRTPDASFQDWDLWRRRVQTESSTEGIFPRIFFEFDSDPASARDILKTIIFKGIGGRSAQALDNETTLLRFLFEKKAFDEELDRYCLQFLLEKDDRYGSLDFYFGLLRRRPLKAYAGQIWAIFERPGFARKISAGLWMEAFWSIAGDDAGWLSAMTEKLNAKTRPEELEPYFDFLDGNLSWPGAVPLFHVLESLLRSKPALGELKNGDRLRRLAVDLKIEILAPDQRLRAVQTPGLLDD